MPHARQTILIIDGHPDPRPERFCHALAAAYERGALQAGHTVECLTVAPLHIPLLHSRDEWEKGSIPPAIHEAQAMVARAQHIVIVYPLWLGSMPAFLKAFFEQLCRPGFAIKEKIDSMNPGLLTGKSARVIVTMGMPAFVYAWYFRAHSLKSLERNILRFVGIKPIKHTIIGMVEGSAERREQWLATVENLGKKGA